MPDYPSPQENPKCICPSLMAAMVCMTGHMTECHYPMTCVEAECSHWEVNQKVEEEFDQLENIL